MTTTKITAKALELIQEQYQTALIDTENALNELNESRAHGDLSENSEYLISQENYQMKRLRSQELANIITHAEIVTVTTYHSYVSLGATVTVKDLDTNLIETFTFVDKALIDPLNDLLSTDCPMYKALKGLREGDEAIVYASVVNRLSILAIQ